jgi:hypothetical protein
MWIPKKDPNGTTRYFRTSTRKSKSTKTSRTAEISPVTWTAVMTVMKKMRHQEPTQLGGVPGCIIEVGILLLTERHYTFI